MGLANELLITYVSQSIGYQAITVGGSRPKRVQKGAGPDTLRRLICLPKAKKGLPATKIPLEFECYATYFNAIRDAVKISGIRPLAPHPSIAYPVTEKLYGRNFLSSWGKSKRILTKSDGKSFFRDGVCYGNGGETSLVICYENCSNLDWRLKAPKPNYLFPCIT